MLKVFSMLEHVLWPLKVAVNHIGTLVLGAGVHGEGAPAFLLACLLAWGMGSRENPGPKAYPLHSLQSSRSVCLSLSLHPKGLAAPGNR